MELVDGIGERVAELRKARDLTQDGLAMRMHRSVSWVSKVEQGKRRVENVRTLTELAAALGVTLADLRTDLAEPSRADALRALRRALTITRPDVEPGDIASDVRALGDAWFGDGDRAVLADLVPDVVVRARAAGGAGVVGSACMVAGSLARRLGEPDLQWIAGHRAIEAAADEVSEAWARYRLALRALQLGDVEEARILTDQRPQPSSNSSAAAGGSLALTGAIAAVRDSDREAADALLAEAATRAEQVGDSDLLWSGFGPANVNLHRIAVELEDLRAVAALEISRRVIPSALPSAERRYAHRVALAQACVALREDTDAVRHLLAAEQIDADALAHDVCARELVAAMLRRKGRRPAGLRRLATRLGVASS